MTARGRAALGALGLTAVLTAVLVAMERLGARWPGFVVGAVAALAWVAQTLG